MSRIDYGEYDPVQQGRWLARLRSTLLGKRGQAALALLEEELEQMPVKELAYGRLCSPTYEGYTVCTVGALAHARGYSYLELYKMQQSTDGGADALAEWASTNLDVSYTLAWLLQELNDELWGERFSPQERYEKLLAWVERARAEPLQVWREYQDIHTLT